MLQRVGLCQSLLHDPELIILDEPMSGLDPLGRALVRDIIVDEQTKGKTIFFSSHVLSDVQSICSRVAILVGGKLRGVGTVGELIGEHIDWLDVVVDISETGASRLNQMADLRHNDGMRYHFRISPEQSAGFQEAVRSNDGKLVELKPQRATLESVLVREMQAEASVGEKQ
jgi:ABC-2 type transport system ATP-binding protein